MKTFEDLEFKTHPNRSGKQARLDFKNGYGVSVVFDELYYSDGISTYELAIFKDGKLTYNVLDEDTDVYGYITIDDINKIMEELQSL